VILVNENISNIPANEFILIKFICFFCNFCQLYLKDVFKCIPAFVYYGEDT
jgi:hypothetical protein